MQINPDALAAIRTKDGMSQSELSRASGVSQSLISQIESGTRGAGPATVKALADALAIPVSALCRINA